MCIIRITLVLLTLLVCFFYISAVECRARTAGAICPRGFGACRRGVCVRPCDFEVTIVTCPTEMTETTNMTETTTMTEATTMTETTTTTTTTTTEDSTSEDSTSEEDTSEDSD